MTRSRRISTFCCIVLLSALLSGCVVGTAVGATVSVVAEVIALPFKLVGAAVDAIIP